MLRFFLLLSLSSSLWGSLSTKQLTTLQIIRDIAKTIPDYKGETYENTLAAICLTESSGGIHIIGDLNYTVREASLGSMQIRIETARHIAGLTPALAFVNELSDQKLATLLITDVKTSATIAAHLLVRLSNSRKSYYPMISGYNGGWYNRPYYKRVMKNYAFIEKLIKKGLLN